MRVMDQPFPIARSNAGAASGVSPAQVLLKRLDAPTTDAE